MKKLFKNNTMLCFSPGVMMATFVAEVAMAVWILFRRKLNTTVQISVVLLLCLATFQLSEYAVCEGRWLSSNLWAKIGFSAITLLPPLGLHLVYTIARRKERGLVWLSYAVAVVWIGIFWLGGIMHGHLCEGNYVIFEIKDPAESLYYIYYNSVILLAMVHIIRFWRTAKNSRRRYALKALFVGYLAFILPAIAVRFMFDITGEATSSAMPSILCGFAVLLAVILTFKVVPNDAKRK